VLFLVISVKGSVPLLWVNPNDEIKIGFHRVIKQHKEPSSEIDEIDDQLSKPPDCIDCGTCCRLRCMPTHYSRHLAGTLHPY